MKDDYKNTNKILTINLVSTHCQLVVLRISKKFIISGNLGGGGSINTDPGEDSEIGKQINNLIGDTFLCF